MKRVSRKGLPPLEPLAPELSQARLEDKFAAYLQVRCQKGDLPLFGGCHGLSCTIPCLRNMSCVHLLRPVFIVPPQCRCIPIPGPPKHQLSLPVSAIQCHMGTQVLRCIIPAGSAAALAAASRLLCGLCR